MKHGRIQGEMSVNFPKPTRIHVYRYISYLPTLSWFYMVNSSVNIPVPWIFWDNGSPFFINLRIKKFHLVSAIKFARSWQSVCFLQRRERTEFHSFRVSTHAVLGGVSSVSVSVILMAWKFRESQFLGSCWYLPLRTWCMSQHLKWALWISKVEICWNQLTKYQTFERHFQI